MADSFLMCRSFHPKKILRPCSHARKFFFAEEKEFRRWKVFLRKILRWILHKLYALDFSKQSSWPEDQLHALWLLSPRQFCTLMYHSDHLDILENRYLAIDRSRLHLSLFPLSKLIQNTKSHEKMSIQRNIVHLYLISPKIPSRKSQKISDSPKRQKLQKIITFDHLVLWQKKR